MLNKIVFKSLKKSKFLIMSVAVLFAFSTILLSLSILTFKNLEEEYASFVKDTNQEDYRFYGISELEQKYDQGFVYGFESQFDSKIEKHKYFQHEEQEQNYIILDYQNYEINKAILTSGEYPVNENEILISSKTSESLNLKVGDSYKLNDIDYKISAIGYIPEYTLPMDIATSSGGFSDDSFIPIYMNSLSYEKFNKSQEILYFSGKFNNPVANEVETFKQMKEKFFTSIMKVDEFNQPIFDENFNPVTNEIDLINFVLPVKANFPLSGFELEIENDKTMFRVMSVVVISITLCLTVVLFNNIFRTQKREMGILKAEGISFKELSYRFSIGLFFVTFISSMIGFVIAILLVKPLTNMLLSFYQVPVTSAAMPYLNNFLILLLLNLFLCFLVYILAIYRNLKMPPLFLIKNIESQKLPSKRLFKFLDKTSFKTRYRINIMVRNFKTTLILIFGVFVSSFLLLLGMLMVTSIKDMVEQTYSEMFIYDYSATYKTPDSFNEHDYSILEKQTNIVSTSSEKVLKEDTTMTLYGFKSSENDLINLSNLDSKPIVNSALQEGIVVSNLLAKTLEVEKGDTITFENPYGDKNISMRVSEVASDGTSFNAYFDIDYLQNQLNVDSNFVTGEVGLGDKKAELEKIDSQITYNDASADEKQTWDSIKVVLQVVIVQSSFAVIISFISLITISSIVISKNKKTISVMKVLGYTDNEVNNMTTSIYKWVVILVYFTALPLFERLFQVIINQALGESDFAVVIKIDLFAALFGFAIIFATYLISSKISKRAIKKISLAESLKVDE